MAQLGDILKADGFNFRYSRLKDVIYQVGVASQSAVVSACVASGEWVDPFSSPIWHAPKHLPKGLIIPQGDFFKHAIQGGEDPEVWVMLKEGVAPTRIDSIVINSKGTNHLEFVAVLLQFMRYYETYRSYSGAAFKFDWDKIPEVWRFANVVRNAIAHSGRIKIENPTFKKVVWAGLEYDHSSNGRLLEADLGECDLLILLMHMDLTLMDYEQGAVLPSPGTTSVQIYQHWAVKSKPDPQVR